MSEAFEKEMSEVLGEIDELRKNLRHQRGPMTVEQSEPALVATSGVDILDQAIQADLQVHEVAEEYEEPKAEEAEEAEELHSEPLMRNRAHPQCMALKLSGNFEIEMELEGSGERVLIRLEGGELKVRLASGAEWKVPLRTLRMAS
jgi:hypothetical protein